MSSFKPYNLFVVFWLWLASIVNAARIQLFTLRKSSTCELCAIKFKECKWNTQRPPKNSIFNSFRAASSWWSKTLQWNLIKDDHFNRWSIGIGWVGNKSAKTLKWVKVEAIEMRLTVLAEQCDATVSQNGLIDALICPSTSDHLFEYFLLTAKFVAILRIDRINIRTQTFAMTLNSSSSLPTNYFLFFFDNHLLFVWNLSAVKLIESKSKWRSSVDTWSPTSRLDSRKQGWASTSNVLLRQLPTPPTEKSTTWR